MAISIDNLITAGLSGDLGGQIVFKHYRKRQQTVISKKPDMSKVIPSENQLKEKSRFAEAIRFAQDIIRDPAKKAAYKVKEGETVYNTAIKDYMKKNK
jgi:co-chaperonin GroES (HSP10)